MTLYNPTFSGCLLRFPGNARPLSFSSFDDAVIYTLALQNDGHGLIFADKSSGYNGQVVTLSNTPSAGYQFGSYGITGATLTGNQFAFNDSNVTAKVFFDPITYNLTLQNDGHGTLAATKTTGHIGDTSTLSTSPASNYTFSAYTVTGGSINGNTFTFQNADAIVKAWFRALKMTVNLNSQGEEQTTEFRNKSSDWNNFRVFKTNKNRTTGTFNNYLQNISRAGSNFTLWYYLDCYYNNTSKAYGQIQYTSDSSNLVGKTAGWTKAGLDSQNPRYQKSRWRSVTVNVSKGGNLKFIFGQPSSDIWYTGAMYWAVDKNLLE